MAQGILALLVANFIGGALSPIFVKLGVGEFPPLTFTAFRFILASLFILPIFLRKKENILSDKKLILLNSLFFAGNVAFFSIAIQYTTVIVSQIIYTFDPIIVGVLSIIFLKEQLTRNKIIGMVIASLGIFFLISQSYSSFAALSLGTPLGNILTCLAALSWASYLVTSKKLHQKYNSITISLSNFIFTAIILSLLTPFELSIRPFQVESISLTGLISLFGVAIFSSVLMIFLIQVGIKRLGAFLSSLFGYTSPFFAAMSAIPLLGEKITPQLIIGGGLVIFGVFYATTYSLWMNKKNY